MWWQSTMKYLFIIDGMMPTNGSKFFSFPVLLITCLNFYIVFIEQGFHCIRHWNVIFFSLMIMLCFSTEKKMSLNNSLNILDQIRLELQIMLQGTAWAILVPSELHRKESHQNHIIFCFENSLMLSNKVSWCQFFKIFLIKYSTETHGEKRVKWEDFDVSAHDFHMLLKTLYLLPTSAKQNCSYDYWDSTFHTCFQILPALRHKDMH